jgi:hypothetical protein
MFLLRPSSTLSLRIPCTIALCVILLAAFRVPPVSAQTGAIAFRDDCTGLLYAMRGDGTGRIALPLPSLPLPTDRYWGPLVLDVTTSGPTTVIYYTGIARIVVVDGQNVLTLVDYALFAVQLDEVDGVLSPALGRQCGSPCPRMSAFLASIQTPPGVGRFLLQSFGIDWPLWQPAKPPAC